MTDHRFWRAGPLLFDRVEDRLWCDGKPIALTGKPLGVLRLLLDHAQALVTKEMLLERVWPNVTVSESVLTTAIKELRQAVGDNARTPTFVETVHRRGYRFLLPAEALEIAPVPGEQADPGPVETPAVAPAAVPASIPAPRRRPRLAIWGGAATFLAIVAAALLWWSASRREAASKGG